MSIRIFSQAMLSWEYTESNALKKGVVNQVCKSKKWMNQMIPLNARHGQVKRCSRLKWKSFWLFPINNVCIYSFIVLECWFFKQKKASTLFKKLITETDYQNIKYKEIYLSWKPIIDFSWDILKRKQISLKQEKTKNGYGFFLDMAEIWEQYLRSLLKKNLQPMLVLNMQLLFQTVQPLFILQW